MGSLRRILNYTERIILPYPTNMMSMIGHVAIGVEKPRIGSGYSLEKEFIELIRMNP